jgi:hypothetical protein
MTAEKRARPIAVCTLCGYFEYQMPNINGQCLVQIDSKRCRGVLSGAMDPGDWKECSDCVATGRRDDAECLACNGSGWHYLRPRIGILQ